MSILADMLSSKTRAEFFTLLFGLEPAELHLREIERRSGLAIGTVRQEAAKLERLGLICKRRSGNRTYYQANSKHALYTTLHELVLKTSGLADIIRAPLTTDAVEYAFVFGSIGAETGGVESGINLVVVGDIGLRSLAKLLREPAEKLGRTIEPHVMTAHEFIDHKAKADPFVTSLLASPKLMIKGAEEDLAILDVLKRKPQRGSLPIVPVHPGKKASSPSGFTKVLDALIALSGTRG
jgi:uncharacterized protein